jgi:signal peptidase II
MDRLFREPSFARGWVVDFIAYWNVFVGNVADIAIVVGAGIIMVLSFRGTSLAGPVHRPGHADE